MDALQKLFAGDSLTATEKAAAFELLSNHLVNGAEAAHLTNASRTTIENYVKNGQLRPVINRPNNKIYWKNDILTLKEVIQAKKQYPRGHKKTKQE